MKVAIVTGSGGLIGAEAARFFSKRGFYIVGIDNNMRAEFFGPEASTAWSVDELKTNLLNYKHYSADIRDMAAIRLIFEQYGSDIALVVHTAAQPSHDWAARAPLVDFGVNATGTINLLECTRLCAPEAVFIFTSTNKVYGDRPNTLPLRELDTRWEIEAGHEYECGIGEGMSIDASTHSVFGASKVAADIMVQEYGRYFKMKTAVFRGGCLTGPGHSGAELHGFLAYLMKCCANRREYCIFGYKGKQVRDNIHSYDLIQAFYEFYKRPRHGEVYNIGGGRYSNCSMQEAISICESICGNKMETAYVDDNRVGDHIWWISGLQKFESHYPDWRITYDVPRILGEVYTANVEHREAIPA
ncbi:MAG TPA: NAD-dependent epimerase/dehydratase family protein [Candidatus Hydrogenedentes bacterium]|nr:NAD-dependent epimerase/dehydratase family protein [Candidatus Hydrogenedentota bacterium]HRK35654.1 NAD-dependent epimerase/dehydratase family protein [Candidatus Hydrogenedentota bacterium]